MEFRFNVDHILQKEFNCVDNSIIIEGWQTNSRNRLEYQQLYDIINVIGEASSFSQGLNRIITSSEKLQNSDHLLYLMKEYEPHSGRTLVVGMLKIGRKKLFLLDESQATKEVAPLCVLDFYIHESRQRRGYGRRLFDYMLKHQNIEPRYMAVDKPSDKFMFFLKKHYRLEKQVEQINNFVVYESFFHDRPVVSDEMAMTYVRSNRSSRTASPEGIRTPPSGNRKSSLTGFAGKPSKPRDCSSMSDILHGKVEQSLHTSKKVGNKHQNTLDWMRGSCGGDSPFSRTPRSCSPSQNSSYVGSPLARTPRAISPQRSSPPTPPKQEVIIHQQTTVADGLDVKDGIRELSVAPTPTSSPERKVKTVEPPLHDEVETNGDILSVSDKMEELSVEDPAEGRTGGWRDNISRNSDNLVEHLALSKGGSTMTGVLRENESVHGHLKFHHHALW